MMSPFTQVIVAFLTISVATTVDAVEPVAKILFGSCVKQEQPMRIFRAMIAEEADFTIFLGDNIYADTIDMDVMRSKYERLSENEDFRALRRATPLLATWDDHDFGVNDGGASFLAREGAESEFLRFWDVPEDSPRRVRPGIYDAQAFGPPGKRVQVLLLDTRFFRSDLRRGEKRVGGPYVPDPDPKKTMLGEQQWQWLRTQFRRPAELRIVASSIQFAAEDAGQETWSNLPQERSRMLKLIRDTGAEGVLFLSGDRHWAELSAITDGVDYPIYDITSSSFNQLHARGTPTDNRFRSSDRTFHRENYGSIRIDWEEDDAAIDLRIVDIDGKTQLRKTIRLSELRKSK